MKRETFEKRTVIDAPAEAVYRWHVAPAPGAFERLTPPWQRVKVLSGGKIENGSRVELSVPTGPIRRRWIAEHQDVEPGRGFVDVQIEGPFAFWRHTHRFEPHGKNQTEVIDHVEYALPWGAAGGLMTGYVTRQLDRLFHYRHRVTAADLLTQQREADKPRRHVWITGATGLVGSRLMTFLTTAGHTVSAVSRRRPSEMSWDPTTGEVVFDPAKRPDVVVHLAGENLAAGRWSVKRRAAIESSRVDATRKLCETLARMHRESNRPATLLCASAVGFYGSRGDEVLTEDSTGGEGFLADVCRGWEGATHPASEAGVRVVNMRLGLVLWPAGGALAKMLPVFRAGLGGVVGSGRQYWSWISLDDVVYVMHEAMIQPGISGPINVVAPQAVTSRQFVQTLGRVLRRPTLLPAPAGMLRLVLGEMAEQTLLASQRAEPTRLIAAGMRFAYPGLEGAMRHMLGR